MMFGVANGRIELIGEEWPVRLNLDSEIGLARFSVETKHETKPNLPNSADMLHRKIKQS